MTVVNSFYYLHVASHFVDLPEWAEIDRTLQVSLPGPFGETPFLSERDLVVAVDHLGVFILGGLRAAQEVDHLGDDLAAVAVGAGWTCTGFVLVF